MDIAGLLEAAAAGVVVVTAAVSSSLWATRKVRGIVESQRREREKTQREIADLRFDVLTWQNGVKELLNSREQLLADTKALQEQVASLTKRATDTEFMTIKGLANVNRVIEEIQQDVAQLQAEVKERTEVSELQAEVNSYLKGFCEDLEQRLIPLQEQVKELDKGWLRLGGKQNTPQ